MNKAIVAGYVGKDPTLNDTNGGPVANLSIATSTSWKDKRTGERKEKTEWHRITAFGSTAQLVAEYIRKGSYLTVEGHLQTSEFKDRETGATRYSTSIIAERVYFGPRTSSSATTTPEDEQGDTSFPPEDDLPY